MQTGNLHAIKYYTFRLMQISVIIFAYNTVCRSILHGGSDPSFTSSYSDVYSTTTKAYPDKRYFYYHYLVEFDAVAPKFPACMIVCVYVCKSVMLLILLVFLRWWKHPKVRENWKIVLASFALLVVGIGKIFIQLIRLASYGIWF